MCKDICDNDHEPVLKKRHLEPVCFLACDGPVLSISKRTSNVKILAKTTTDEIIPDDVGPGLGLRCTFQKAKTKKRTDRAIESRLRNRLEQIVMADLL